VVHAALMREMLEKPREYYLKYIGINWMVILRWIVLESVVKVKTGFIWVVKR